ncbi:S-layer homology domain-containing protein [Paenibacillus oryzisoli]|uniref:golvesin C-terminal-like domain-containing protein n=1 Tax=Paenibacillus oryzisoli TaxID=1850517 RepID=UPI003D2A1961
MKKSLSQLLVSIFILSLFTSLFPIVAIGATEIIVDNTDPGAQFIGSWPKSATLPTRIGTNYQHDGNTGKGQKSAIFTPNLPSDGYYQVYAFWNSQPPRASNVPIVVTYVDDQNQTVSETVYVNQNLNGGQWNLLGTYKFLAGTSGKVTYLTTGTEDGTVIADAVKFKTLETSSVKASIPSGNAADGTTVSLTTDTSPATIYYTTDNSDPKTSPTRQTYDLPIPIHGTLTLKTYAYSVQLGDGPVTDYSYEAYNLPMNIIVDNKDSGAQFNGSWSASATSPDKYGTDYKHDGNTGKGQKSAVYTPNLPFDGYYNVYAYWNSTTPRATKAPLVITYVDDQNQTVSETVYMNQSLNGGQWNLLGTYKFLAGTSGKVTYLTTGTEDGYVIADAVKFGLETSAVKADLPSGFVTDGTTVSLSTYTNPATIYYTTDDSDPKTSLTRQVYVQPIPIHGKVTIKTYAVSDQMGEAPITVYSYYTLKALTIGQVQLGNIFFESEPKSFDIVPQGDSLIWSVKDNWGTVLMNGEELTPTHDLKRLTIPLAKKGYFELSLIAKQAGIAVAGTTTSFAILSDNNPGANAEDSPFSTSTHLKRVDQGWSEDLLELIKRAGIKNVRDGISWSDMEPQKGVYTFSQQYTAIRDKIRDLNLNPFMVLAYTNPNYDGNQVPYTDEGRLGFAKFAQEVVKFYGDDIKEVEVWNEYNIRTKELGIAARDPVYYTMILKETYEALKEIRPDITVVGGATSGISAAKEWLVDVFEHDGLNYMDELSVHRYPIGPEGIETEIQDMFNTMKIYNQGQTKPIWLSETGYSTLPYTGSKYVDEQTQAFNLVRSYLVGLSAGLDKITWYDFMNDGVLGGTSSTAMEDNFGLIRHKDDAMGSYTPKPSYVAYAAMTRYLSNTSFVAVDSIEDGGFSYHFDQSGTDVSVLWSPNAKNVTLETSNPLRVADMMGNEKTLFPSDGKIYVSISPDPIYVVGKVDEVKNGSPIYMSGSAVGVSGEQLPVTLVADYTLSQQNADIVFSIDDQNFSLQASAGNKVKKDVVLPALDISGKQRSYSDLTINGTLSGRLMVESQIRPEALAIKILPQTDVGSEGNEGLVRFQVTNNSSQKTYLLQNADWSIGGQQGTLELNSELAPLSSTVLSIQAEDIQFYSSYPLTIQVTVAGGAPLTYEGTISTNPVYYQTNQVDGNLQEQTGYPFVKLGEQGKVVLLKANATNGGESDLSGNVYLNWDHDNVYLSASIKDDVHTQNNTQSNIWNGDSIQFAFAVPELVAENQWYEFGMALTKEGAQLYRWSGPSSVVFEPAGPDRISIKRDEASGTTVYELAIPWAQLLPAQDQRSDVAFSLVVNDDDGAGRLKILEWGSGIAQTKNPALFKPLIFAGATGGDDVQEDGSTQPPETPTTPTVPTTPTIPTTPLPEVEEHPEKDELENTIFQSSAVDAKHLIDTIKEKLAAPAANNPIFQDVSHHWAAADIATSVKLGFINGYQDGSFQPDGITTRAEFVTMITRAFQIQGDVPDTGNRPQDIEGHWAEKVIGLLYAKGIISGYPDGSFLPDNRITRAEMVSILSKLVDLGSIPHTNKKPLEDIENTWNANEVQSFYEAGFIQGKDEFRFKPEDSATRAESVVMIMRMLKLDKQLSDILG